MRNVKVNKRYAQIYDPQHLRYSTLLLNDDEMQLAIGFKKVVKNEPEVREGYEAQFDHFDEDDTTIFNVYTYVEIPQPVEPEEETM